MPEGHVIHRLAAATNQAFGGRVVRVMSPQGRFAASAEFLDGHVLDIADACGKHLFIEFDAPVSQPIVHIHLGLIGKFFFQPLADPVGQVRLRISDDKVAADLHGPQWCRLISHAERDEVVASLGPDPIRADADPERAWVRVHRSTKPIAALLMDQRIFAGVGNIFRAEVLYRHGLDPLLPGRDLKRSTFDSIWGDLVYLMRAATDVGRIDTVLPEHLPDVMGRPPRVDRHGGEVYVYRRADDLCHVCGAPIRTSVLEGRNLYWCPVCQKAPRSRRRS